MTQWTSLLSTLAAALLAWSLPSGLCAETLPELMTGDIVFQESGNSQSAAIALASGSLYTHTALIEVSEDGKPFVVEAAGPVRTVPFEQWIKNGTGGRFTVKRLKGLDRDGAKKVLQAAHAYDGRPYDPYFYEDADAIYCSELVHRAFIEGAGIGVGRVERVKDLQIGNRTVAGLIEARWRQHPLCTSRGARDFNTCFALIREQTLVTPAAIARDQKLDLVFTNFRASAE